MSNWLSGVFGVFSLQLRNRQKGNENTGQVMPTKFVNVLETNKLRIRGQYLDSVSYVLLHFLTLRLYENLVPGQ